MRIIVCAALLFAACARPPAAARPDALPPGAEAVSLLGRPLVPAPPSEAARARLEAQLAEARAAYERHPENPDSLIWYGRRTAYLGRYRDAIAIFSEGVRRHPRDARMYRHRGHRYITTRRFDRAIADLRTASRLVAGQPDEIEPDGIPNARNQPTSTLQSNIWYHLGLAQYLVGDYVRARRSYRECLRVSLGPDNVVATTHWLYMTLRRMGRAEEAAQLLAPIRADLDVIESGDYLRLLLLYKDELPADSLLAPTAGGVSDATLGYGVGNWHLYNGRAAEAERIWRAVVEGSEWGAFGYIAAEAELARGRGAAAPTSSPRDD